MKALDKIKELVTFARKNGVKEDKIKMMVENRVKRTAQDERLDLVMMDIINQTQCVICGHPMPKGISCSKCNWANL